MGDAVGYGLAYWRYFLLHNPNQRKKMKKEFMEIIPVSEEEFEGLVHMQMQADMLTRKSVEEFTTGNKFKFVITKPEDAVKEK